MSDSTIHNLLTGTEGLTLSATLPEDTSQYVSVAQSTLSATRAKGDSFTLSFEVRMSAAGEVSAYLYNRLGNVSKDVYVDGSLENSGVVDGHAHYDAGPEWRCVAISWEYLGDSGQPVEYVIPARLFRANTAAGTTVEVRNLMMVRGTTPAAWSPAEGETLSGGGCSDER